MTISRIFLILSGLSFCLFGLYCLFNPLALQEFASVELNNSTALTEVRAMYGGLEITIGLYLFICGFKPSMVSQGLVLMVFCFAGLAGARAFGMSIDNDNSTYHFSAIAYETISGLIALVLLQFQSDKKDPVAKQ